jgi:hypothetical protein
MRKYNKINISKSSFYRAIAATLTVSGVSLLSPMLALALTAAGTEIKNTATGTYEDPNAPGIPINATSNEVTVTVAEVAGITATGNGISDSTPGSAVLPNDILTYSFLITNVGNDTTQVQIPAPVITGPGALGPAEITYEVKLTLGGAFVTVTDLAAAQAAILEPGGQIKVSVPVTVALSATSGAPIKVQLGDTGVNDNSAATQNQISDILGSDLRTVDAPDGTLGERDGAVAPEREASAIQQILVGATPQAFAAVLKIVTASAPGPNVSPDFTDDLITYGLSLRVNSAAPTGSSPALTPTDLTGTLIKVAELNGGVAVTTVLVSDVIPTNTVLNAAPTAPAGWTVVYTNDATTINANDANWTTTVPVPFPAVGTVTRVGFIKELVTNTTATDPIAKDTTVTGFAFQVKTTGLTTDAGGSIYNIAQLFGGSVGGTTVVYDESGDQTPSNFNDDGSTGPGITNGVANPATDGVDSNNNNTGTGVGGEDNVFTLAPAGAILNGPLNAPAAVGPTDNNDDFTNKSTAIPAGTLPLAVIDPESITFTNTLNAPTTPLNNVLVRPVAPATPSDIPVDTLATLTFGAQTAVYKYDGAIFVFQSGVAIRIPNIPANSSVNYTVAVDLPAGTALSTDTNKGYPVPILAFSDTNGNGVLDLAEANNTTIDRVYTGFLKLLKQSQIIQSTGPALVGSDGTLSDSAKTPSPGNIIRYAINYTNISTVPVGAGNVILDASKVIITDDGTGTTSANNNWGKVITGTLISTSHVLSSAVDSGTGSVITFFADATGSTPVTEQSGTTPTTDITKYVDTLSVPVGPGVTRTFEFQRKLN